MNKDWNVPLTTQDKYIGDNKFPYKFYVSIVLNSKHNIGEDHRFIYLSDLKDNKDNICDELGIKKSTFYSSLNRLKEEAELVKAIKVGEEIVLKLYHKDKYGRSFVTIPYSKLRKMADVNSKILIKTYIVLKYSIKKNETKRVTNEWLSKKIGISNTSKRLIRNCLDELKEKGYIDYWARKERDENGEWITYRAITMLD
ncbi:MAG: hypothetical protein ACRC28_18475 [Clostridium sp.]|uniref:hypothetical protein n=1 Tax=Clostridium sp. TaxID=1506 RepID=UPI003F32BF19